MLAEVERGARRRRRGSPTLTSAEANALARDSISRRSTQISAAAAGPDRGRQVPAAHGAHAADPPPLPRREDRLRRAPPCDAVLSCFMANFQLNRGDAQLHRPRGGGAHLRRGVRRLDARRRRCCRSTSTASATSAWSRIWRARCGRCSTSSACPGIRRCSTIAPAPRGASISAPPAIRRSPSRSTSARPAAGSATATRWRRCCRSSRPGRSGWATRCRSLGRGVFGFPNALDNPGDRLAGRLVHRRRRHGSRTRRAVHRASRRAGWGTLRSLPSRPEFRARGCQRIRLPPRQIRLARRASSRTIWARSASASCPTMASPGCCCMIDRRSWSSEAAFPEPEGGPRSSAPVSSPNARLRALLCLATELSECWIRNEIGAPGTSTRASSFAASSTRPYSKPNWLTAASKAASARGSVSIGVPDTISIRGSVEGGSAARSMPVILSWFCAASKLRATIPAPRPRSRTLAVGARFAAKAVQWSLSARRPSA